MLLKPKITKYIKPQRKLNFGPSNRNKDLLFQKSFGLKATESYPIKANQLEAARKAVLHCTKRVGRLVIRIFPDKAITARSKESRMGSGKGSIDFWIANIRKNVIIFEMYNVTNFLGIKALKSAQSKLPIKTEIIFN